MINSVHGIFDMYPPTVHVAPTVDVVPTVDVRAFALERARDNTSTRDKQCMIVLNYKCVKRFGENMISRTVASLYAVC